VRLAPVPPPSGPVTREGHEYLHVVVDGVYLSNHDTLVQAVTDFGPGYWVMTPLCRPDGSIVLVNRGFVPNTTRAPVTTRAAVIPANAGTPGAPHATSACSTSAQSTRGPRVRGDDGVMVTGLLRLSEPTGAFLRHNDPSANRWYSRDVDAIAVARALPHVASYFIDADASAQPAQGEPIGGLTVIHFPNNHLQYALTWYAMALMAAAALIWILRTSRQRKPTP